MEKDFTTEISNKNAYVRGDIGITKIVRMHADWIALSDRMKNSLLPMALEKNFNPRYLEFGAMDISDVKIGWWGGVDFEKWGISGIRVERIYQIEFSIDIMVMGIDRADGEENARDVEFEINGIKMILEAGLDDPNNFTLSMNTRNHWEVYEKGWKIGGLDDAVVSVDNQFRPMGVDVDFNRKEISVDFN